MLHGFRMEVMASESAGIWYIDALPDSGYQPPNAPSASAGGDFSYQFAVLTTDGLENAPDGSVLVAVRLTSSAASGHAGVVGTAPLGSLAGAVLDGVINCEETSNDPINYDSGWLVAHVYYNLWGQRTGADFFRYEITNGQKSIEGDNTGFVYMGFAMTVKMYVTFKFSDGVPDAGGGALRESSEVLFGASLEAKLSE